MTWIEKVWIRQTGSSSYCHREIRRRSGRIDTLSASIGEDAGTIEDVYEPYLLKNGFIQRTPRGRIVTEKLNGHLGISYENNEKIVVFYRNISL